MLDRLQILTGPDSGNDRCINLANGPVLVGRSHAQATLVLSDLNLSRVHFEIIDQNGSLWIVDQDSSTGTFVNGQKVTSHQLKSGDIIQAGNTQMRYLPAGAAEPPKPANQAPRLEDLVGRELAHFHIRKLIGRGATGCIFLAQDDNSGDLSALKVLYPELARTATEVNQFAQAMSPLLPHRHPHLVTVYGAGRTGNYCWVSMEYIDGESLAHIVKRIGKEGKLPWKFALRIAVHLARGLHYAEQHDMLHRRITPDNVLVRAADQTAVLGDLMLAQALEASLEARRLSLAQAHGIPTRHMPQSKKVDQRDRHPELFTLGATIYAVLTGHSPQEGLTLVDKPQNLRAVQTERPSQKQPNIDPAFEAIVLKMLDHDIAQRFQSAASLLQALERAAQSCQVVV